MRPAAAARSCGTRACDWAVGTELHHSSGKSLPERQRPRPVCMNITRDVGPLPSTARARGLPVSNGDRTSCYADSSTHAQTKSRPIRIRPSHDALPAPQGLTVRLPAPEILEGGEAGGWHLRRGWARRARGPFHPSGHPMDRQCSCHGLLWRDSSRLVRSPSGVVEGVHYGDNINQSAVMSKGGGCQSGMVASHANLDGPAPPLSCEGGQRCRHARRPRGGDGDGRRLNRRSPGI
jgi:hypothetical protein